MRVAFLVALAVCAASPAVAKASWTFHCDGTDTYLLEELNAAFESGIGYGETWDETVCNQGNLVLGEGVRLYRKPHPLDGTPVPGPMVPGFGDGEAAPAGLAADAATAPMAGIGAIRPEPVLTPLEKKMQDQYFAIFIPVFGLLCAAICVFIAAIFIVVIRTRKQILVNVDCPACAMSMPFVVGESTHLFCPACGAASRIDVEVTGDHALAAAVPL